MVDIKINVSKCRGSVGPFGTEAVSVHQVLNKGNRPWKHEKENLII